MKTNRVGVLLLLSTLAASQTLAGVFDDVKMWWHLDYDANNDGIVQVDELRDQTDWGTTTTKGNTGYHALNIDTPDAIAWINNVPITSGGLPYGGMAIVMAPVTNTYYTYTTNQVGVVTTNSVKQCWAETIKVSNAAVKGSCTILCRFRWDGPAMETWNEPGWIVNNALNYDKWLGWMFGVRKSDDNYFLGMYIGREAQYYWDVPLIRGTWYEAGAILRDNGVNDSVTFYLWPEDYWPDEDSRTELSGLTWKTYNSTKVTNVLTSADILIGAEEQFWSLSSSQNATKSFRGALNYLAIWERDLSHNEMLEAFGYHSPLLTIGIKNNNNTELRIESQTPWSMTSATPGTQCPGPSQCIIR
ncbi:MAG: hypothetical protein PHO37_17510 [Kiritimatiellae bacterium]|nr:hypothetical protein [Kiritimatiellia bacterium]